MNDMILVYIGAFGLIVTLIILIVNLTKNRHDDYM